MAARGFKVRLQCGTVGRCVELLGDAPPGATASAYAAPAARRSPGRPRRRRGKRRDGGLPDVVRLREENARRQEEIWAMLQEDAPRRDDSDDE